MRLMSASCYAIIILSVLFSVPASAQDAKRNEDKETCEQPVFERKDLKYPAIITSKPEPQYTEEARAHGVHGAVILTAVLCKSGKVTDIFVVKEMPYGITEKVVEAARKIKFVPAEKDGQQVSQTMRLEYNFSLY